ncbi:M14 family murein peptide amidase A [Candidatus Magnetaquicoccus inordinatus]|uniref:M14 family murein peptide amidase A n=1 Tax=Candidatus Magnetaquicoccus inordinatus TaxID=2496818 RepID=UPI00102B28AA|nr:M14 family murein peptide amidase A [Candidatus Magnetaquicoccus inordinatus]
MPTLAHRASTASGRVVKLFSIRRGWPLLCAILLVWSSTLLAADPHLSFQEEVQELVKEAASQSTIVPESAKNGEGKHPGFSVRETCLKIGAKLSSVRVDECHTSQLQPSGRHSVEGYPILLRNILPSTTSLPDQKNQKNSGKIPQARVLLIGGVHGDEYSSISIVFKWLKLMDKHQAGIFHWHIVPLVNPDGLLRKQSTRTNANGVDLNRNFPTRDWKEDSADYWVRRTGKDPRRFPGKSPLSEPETTWLYEEIKQFRPNVIVSIHAPFGLLDFDGPPTTPPERLGNIYLSLLGTYPGSLGRYAVESLKIPIITIELPHAGIMPNNSEIESIWSDLVGWMRNHVFDHTPPESAVASQSTTTKQPDAPASTPSAPQAAPAAESKAVQAADNKASVAPAAVAPSTASATTAAVAAATATVGTVAATTATAANSANTAVATSTKKDTTSPAVAASSALQPGQTDKISTEKAVRSDKIRAQKSKTKNKAKSRNKSNKSKRSGKAASSAATTPQKGAAP